MKTFVQFIMSTSAITSIITLLLTNKCPQYQELLLIRDINKFFTIDENIFVLESSIDINRFVDDFHEPTPRSVFQFERLDDGIKGLASLKEIDSKNPFLIVVSEKSNFVQNQNLLDQVKGIQRLNIDMKIGVFFSHIVRDDLHKLFDWCWQHRIINIFVAFYPNHEGPHSRHYDQTLNVFNYSPFETFDLINVTGCKSVEKYFPDKIFNFKQHPIRMGIYDDIWLFQYSVTNQRIGGPDGKLWKVMLQHLNASFTISVEREQLWQMLKTNAIDVVPFSHRFPESQLAYLYPVNMETEVIAVPEARPYPEFIAYLRSMTSKNIFGYSLITVLSLVILLATSRYIKRKKILLFQCAADVLNLLMNDNGFIKYRQLSGSEAFLIVPLTFAGLVIVNGTLSAFQSYLTQPMIRPQIDTIEDIYESPFPIVTPSKYWASELPNVLGTASKHGNWTNKVHFRKNAELLPQIFTYNTTMSVLLFQTHVKILLEHQKRLNIRGYHMPTHFYILKFLSSYHVNVDFPFIERFNEIIHRLQSAGLYEKWTGELYSEVKDRVFSANRSDYMGTSDESEIEMFPMPKFIIVGWIVGMIVLIFEIVWKLNLKRKIFSRNLK